ncbi:uncharacterized protein LOC110238011 [Exaiptasia diaphana]|uniref:Uncharacterized protein n=1 Tax=Exaiptasia diaphana TaxID=2652724 RepID=A0A913X6M8_EXADI|nr:uncharacterized protein LOC110238011 [Exaiptasia diaphana]KXJ15026.1 hypothetical protein AC249_AIPGENE6567 [Exaiptasia diaphana]
MSVLIRLLVLTIIITIAKCATTKNKQSALQKHDKTPESNRKNELNHAKKTVNIQGKKIEKKTVNIQAKKIEKKKKKVESNKKRKIQEKKKPVTVREFPLNDIFFKGQASNEANRFIRGNTKIGKPLELAYEYTREQDLNDIEERIRRRFIEYSEMER